ncbi:MAG: MltA domain-containing protein [Planctomycetota bacterium]
MSRCTAVAGVGILAVVVAFVAGCPKPETVKPFKPEAKDYGRPLPPGALALRKIDPKDYPNFGLGFANRDGLERAIRYSLEYLAHPSSERRGYPYGDISHARVVASLQRFLEILRTVQSPDALHQAICAEYDVYQSVGCDDRGTVLFTGYYTPIFPGSRQRSGEFKYPLYAMPPDLVKDEEGNCRGRRLPDGGTEAVYWTRREIQEGRRIDGLEIAWLRDPFEAYVVTVQGSAKLQMPDGGYYELGYAANNGHEYVRVGEELIKDGRIKREELSLQTLLRYFREHPNDVWTYTWRNPRYVFFKESKGGPYGSLGQPVTNFRSIATDKQVFPRAALAFYMTNLPRYASGQVVQAPYAAFGCDQDTGGAIRAAGRCDVFMGIGPSAEAIAGRTYSEGKLYYIFLKGS